MSSTLPSFSVARNSLAVVSDRLGALRRWSRVSLLSSSLFWRRLRSRSLLTPARTAQQIPEQLFDPKSTSISSRSEQEGSFILRHVDPRSRLSSKDTWWKRTDPDLSGDVQASTSTMASTSISESKEHSLICKLANRTILDLGQQTQQHCRFRVGSYHEKWQYRTRKRPSFSRGHRKGVFLGVSGKRSPLKALRSVYVLSVSTHGITTREEGWMLPLTSKKIASFACVQLTTDCRLFSISCNAA